MIKRMRSLFAPRKKIVALLPARNERHVLPQCLRTLSLYCDAIVYLDDASQDDSLAIVHALARACRVERILRNDTWHRNEPGDRNRLLDAGREVGGTHFVVLDADELFTANCLDHDALRRVILSLHPGDVLEMKWIQLWRGTANYRHDTSVWTNLFKDFVFCDDGKARYNSDFLHTPRTPAGLHGARRRMDDNHGVLHFQFVDWRKLLVKQAWYRCLERIRNPAKPAAEINSTYAGTVDETNLGVRPCPAEWIHAYPSFDPSVYHMPDAHRERDVLGWFKTHGREQFRDLDIWDVEWGTFASRPGLEEQFAAVSIPRRVAPTRRRSEPIVLSALVSTYNAEALIREKLDDLLAQTIADRMEIVVVDSGSTQNERAIVENYAKRFPNIRYVRTEREVVFAAWNRGIRMARGKYLTTANTDDRLRRDAMEILVDALEQSPDAVLAYGDSLVTVNKGETFAACTIDHVLRWHAFNPKTFLELCYIGPHPVWRKSVHETDGFFDERYVACGDYDMWIRLALKHRFIHIAEPLGLYVQREESVSRGGDLPLREAGEIRAMYRDRLTHAATAG